MVFEDSVKVFHSFHKQNNSMMNRGILGQQEHPRITFETSRRDRAIAHNVPKVMGDVYLVIDFFLFFVFLLSFIVNDHICGVVLAAWLICILIRMQAKFQRRRRRRTLINTRCECVGCRSVVIIQTHITCSQQV